jgi:predicted ATPase
MATRKSQGAQLRFRGKGISKITVSGFKSISDETAVDIRPLTVLAGPNSSGKSSLMQPLLLMKQTLEARYDPGPLLIDGPHVKCTMASQFLSGVASGEMSTKAMTVEVEADGESTKLTFAKTDHAPIEVTGMMRKNVQVMKPGKPQMQRITWEIKVGDSEKKLKEVFEAANGDRHSYFPPSKRIEYSIQRDRCFLNVEASFYIGQNDNGPVFTMPILNSGDIGSAIIRIIHLPGLRGNPERTYPLVPAGNIFPGLFQKYAASVIHAWIKDRESSKLKELNEALDLLGLQSNISTEEIEETQVGINVSRNRKSAESDRVSIADVGLAVSQVLPVLAALIVAEPGQLVYIEQPEIHLHPRAQWRLAKLLANAANRGVRLVIETHSSLLLRGILTSVAKGTITPQKVALHWFTRNEDGVTTVRTADIDEQGRFGDWPADFDDVELTASNDYLDAVEMKLMASRS